MNWIGVVTRSSVVVGLAAVAVVSGMIAGSLIADRAVPAPYSPQARWDSLRSSLSDSVLDLATERFGGELRPQVLSALAGHFESSDSVVLVAVTGQDCLTCEDLGRQLRELLRSADSRFDVVIRTDSAGLETTRSFLARERVRVDGLDVGEPADVLRGREIATPAAMLVTSSGRVVRGVSHPSRLRNVRPRSFAQELGLAAELP